MVYAYVCVYGYGRTQRVYAAYFVVCVVTQGIRLVTSELFVVM